MSAREFRAGLLAPDDAGARLVQTPRTAELVVEGAVALEVSMPRDAVFFVGTVVELGPGPQALVRLQAGHQKRLAYVMKTMRRPPPASNRAHPRVPIDVSVRWVDAEGETHVDRLTDISRGGAFVQTSTRPSVGTAINLQLPTTSVTPVKVASLVRWLRDNDGARGFGVSFQPADSRTSRTIDELVQRMSA